MNMQPRTTIPLLLALGALAGCGSETGIGGTGADTKEITTLGTITGFGSIFVNGIEFETDSAAISVDDNPGGEDDLKLGMVVTVSGTLDDSGHHAVANHVTFDDEVQGPVGAITPGADDTTKILDVLGVQVQIHRTATVFDDTSFDGVSSDDVIEVSGLPGIGGVVVATRVEKKSSFVPGSSEVELKGIVSGLSGQRFELGRFSVDFTGADLSRLPGGAVVNGQQVEVKGTLNGATISATRIKEEDDLFSGGGSSSSSSAKVSIEGIVTDFAGNGSFRVSGQAVDASNAVFTPASLTLANGSRVEVEGPVVDGVLRAVKVGARGGSVRVEASVVAVDSASGNITMGFVPGSLAVTVNNQTLMRDDLKVSNPLTLAAIGAGDFLEIRGYLDGANGVTASEIRRDKRDDDILRGPASDCQPGDGVTVLGLRFGFGSGTSRFRALDSGSISGEDFCRLATDSGLFVKIKDDEKRRDGIVDEAELEN